MRMKKRVIIVGGGASGLTAAIQAARAGADGAGMGSDDSGLPGAERRSGRRGPDGFEAENPVRKEKKK